MNANFQHYQKKKEQLVKEIQDHVGSQSTSLTLNKTTSNLFRNPDKSAKTKKINVDHFNTVLSIDKENLIADVEGMTTYETLVNETLKHGYLPTVVPELKSITIGGAFSGGGIESSSFKYGLVHETIKEADILLGDGRVLTCNSENEYQDLFHAFPNSYGTLGYALRVKVQLIPVKKYVKLTHLRFSDPAIFFEILNQYCTQNKNQETYSYIDGVIFKLNEMYINLGEFVDEAPYTHDYQYMHIYYRSIQTTHEDYLNTLDYIWRWDPDWFWCSKVFFMQNPIIRFIFGKFMLSSKVYAKIMHFFNKHPSLAHLYRSWIGKKESIIQDVLIPVKTAPLFLEFFFQNIGIKPIWICPAQSYNRNKHYDLCPLDPNVLYMDFGFWDSIPTDKEEGHYNREIERIAKELKGFKTLYSDSYYTEDQFWGIYNHPLYLQLKQKYDPQNLLNELYHKCVKP